MENIKNKGCGKQQLEATRAELISRIGQLKRKTQSVDIGWTAYVIRKAEWDSLNPDATPFERDAAMHRIAEDCEI